MTSTSRLARFLAYGLAGSLVEAAFTSLVASIGARRLRLSGPSTPLMVGLYGLALPLFEPLHDRLRGRPAWQRATVYAAGVIGVEALSGWAWRRRTGRVPWEYRSGLAVDGVTRLDYAPLWGLLGLATERLHDALTGRPAAATSRRGIHGRAGVLGYRPDNARGGRGPETQRHRSLLSRSFARQGRDARVQKE
jgi:hypothetical protein